MATLKVIPPAPTPPPPSTYVLTLSEQEVKGLKSLLTHGVSWGTLEFLQLKDLQRLLLSSNDLILPNRFSAIAVVEEVAGHLGVRT
jgi:hypothetical protein